jgi:hypothetical protein
MPMQLAVARRLLPLAVYCGAASAVFALRGIPSSWDLLTAWLLGALFCLSLGNLRSFGRSLLFEWAPLLAALTAYDMLRGVGGGRVPIHGEAQVWIDRHVFGLGAVPSVWLQRRLWSGAHITWFDYAAWGVYMSYFVATPVALAALWLANRALFRRYARQVALLAFACVTVFTLSPTIPPWLASQKGMIGPVTRLVGPIGRSFPLFDPTPLWERGVRLANDLAAFPSLHEGMTVLLVILLWRRARPALRPLLAAYPLAMGFALVYMGEHYVCDIVAGAAFAGGVAYAERRLLRALRTRRARARVVATPPAGAEPGYALAADLGRRPRRAAG